jgi:hypothetical protein
MIDEIRKIMSRLINWLEQFFSPPEDTDIVLLDALDEWVDPKDEMLDDSNDVWEDIEDDDLVDW